jgi:hypothetical protein
LCCACGVFFGPRVSQAPLPGSRFASSSWENIDYFASSWMYTAPCRENTHTRGACWATSNRWDSMVQCEVVRERLLSGANRRLQDWIETQPRHGCGGEAKSKPRHASMAGSGLLCSTRCNGPLGSLAKRARLVEVERMSTLLRAAVASTVRVTESKVLEIGKGATCARYIRCACLSGERYLITSLRAPDRGPRAKRDLHHFPPTSLGPERLVHQSPFGLIYFYCGKPGIPKTLPRGFNCLLLITTRGHIPGSIS